MAKKTEKTFPKALLLTDAVSASVALESVAVDEATGKASDVMVVTLYKGTLAPEAGKKFQAAGGGVFGHTAGSGAAALRALLDALKVHPDAYAVPTSGFNFPEVGGNEPKEAENFDDLSDDEKTDMRESLASFTVQVAEYREAETKSRAATRAVAIAFAGIMSRFPTKKREGIFRDYCKAQAETAVREAWPNAGELKAVADIVTSKNVPGELKFFASIPDALLALMPEGKNGPKAAQAWINGLRSGLATALVESVKQPTGEEAETEDKPLSILFWDAVENVELGNLAADAAMLLGLHKANLPEGALFDVDGKGAIEPAKAVAPAKGYVSKALFGSEGADELLKTFCASFNGYRTEAEKEADKAAREVVKPIATRDFATLPVVEVALHLFRILAGRIDESGEESRVTSCSDCIAILAEIADLVEAVASGEKTLDDILNPKSDAPESEEAAEDDADAVA